MAINISFTRCGLLNRPEVLEEMFLTVLLNESSLTCIFYDAGESVRFWQLHFDCLVEFNKI